MQTPSSTASGSFFENSDFLLVAAQYLPFWVGRAHCSVVRECEFSAQSMPDCWHIRTSLAAQQTIKQETGWSLKAVEVAKHIGKAELSRIDKPGVERELWRVQQHLESDAIRLAWDDWHQIR